MAEFLADEFVQEETAEFIPDEDVVDEPPEGSGAGFAGPSDPPPQAPSPHPSQPVAVQPLRIRWIAAAAAGVFLGATARMLAPPSPVASSDGPVHPLVQPPPEAPPTSVALAPPTPLAPPEAPAPSPTALPSAIPVSAIAPPRGASDAKVAAQQALDRGKAALAIELGENSVALDPTDAGAWLILGAAYLERGAFKDARRCFSTCTKQATHGARGECAALLR